MLQVIDQTHEEKLAMYMKLSKKELAEMLINCNNLLRQRFPINTIYRVNADNTFVIINGEECNCTQSECYRLDIGKYICANCGKPIKGT